MIKWRCGIYEPHADERLSCLNLAGILPRGMVLDASFCATPKQPSPHIQGPRYATIVPQKVSHPVAFCPLVSQHVLVDEVTSVLFLVLDVP